ncbi:MAG: hypothetical protein K0S74_753 [Chlamydiales bacterium]|jgi:membrane-associated phospholipid phosphatase|nr:hypothetical protein [Chlamydiales bacterium]
MSEHNLFPSLKKLAITWGFLALLIMSWLLPPISQIWERIDYTLFNFLNQKFVWYFPGPYFWGLTTLKSFDVFIDIIFIAIAAYHVSTFTAGAERRYKMAQYVFGFLYLVIGIFLIKRGTRVLIHEWIDWDRASPSAVVADAIRLSALFPLMGLKDISHDCFPGDHAAFVFVWAGLMWRYAGKKYGSLAWAIALFCALPRMITGAHWFTDVAVGATTITVILLSLLKVGNYENRAVLAIDCCLAKPWSLRYLPFLH